MMKPLLLLTVGLLSLLMMSTTVICENKVTDSTKSEVETKKESCFSPRLFPSSCISFFLLIEHYELPNMDFDIMPLREGDVPAVDLSSLTGRTVPSPKYPIVMRNRTFVIHTIMALEIFYELWMNTYLELYLGWRRKLWLIFSRIFVVYILCLNGIGIVCDVRNR